jgi:hypothetical protein
MNVLSDRAKLFWRELTAPFANEAYYWRWLDKAKTTKATYLKKRAIENRLDDVVGPGNWDTSYQADARGAICLLSIAAPDDNGAGTHSVKRGAGGGWSDNEIMSEAKRTTSGYTDAFKAAANALGIGRDLYNEGMPQYCSDLHGGFASGTPQMDGTQAPRQQPAPAIAPPAATQQDPAGRQPPRYGFLPPFGKPGKPVYAWAKSMGDWFSVDVLKKMGDYAKTKGQTDYTGDWDEQFSNEVLRKSEEWLKKLPNYRGELNDQGSQPSPAAAPVAAAPLASPDMSGRKRAIAAAVTSLLYARSGRPPTDGETIAAIGEIAASVLNGSGHRGEVLESLKHCTDDRWLGNILAEAQRQIVALSKVSDKNAAADDDVPF